MDPILQVLFSWQFVLFALAVAGVMYVIRVIAEYIMESFGMDPKKPKWWNDLVLPIFPVLLGSFGADFFKSFPYPVGLTTSGDRIVFGLVAGLLSGLVYRVFKAILFQKIEGVTEVINSVTTPATTTTTVNTGTVPTPTGTPVTVSTPNLPSRGQL